MKTINVQPLTLKAFKKYGSFSSFITPEGPSLGQEPSRFYRDLMQLRLGDANVISISALELRKRPLVIDALEYHNRCGECMLAVDSDVIVQLAPATKGEIPYDQIEAFLVPKGTAIVLNYGVWHESPYALSEIAHLFCLLPERTYQNDAYLIRIPPEDQIEILI